MASASAFPSRWLFGPWSDLLLGCGLLYAVCAVAFSLLSPEGSPQATILLPLLMLVVNMPHYAGTLLRVYETRAERRRYAVFSIYATVAVVAWFVIGLRDVSMGSLLQTVYLTWSPWHYSGQNFGLAVMFLRRRGVNMTPGLRRLVYTPFVSSYVLVFLFLHAAQGGTPVSYESGGALSSLVFLPLGVPGVVADGLFWVAATAFLASTVASLVWLSRHTRWGDLLPAVALIITQALWFALPYSLLHWGVSWGLSAFSVMWLAVAHGAQYLWVTTYYARASDNWTGYGRYFAKTLLAGVALWTLPLVIFSPDVLGPQSSHGGLWLLMAAAINIHHFILDGAIWKLRSSRIGAVLLGSETLAQAARASGEGGHWLRRTVWSIVAVGFGLGIVSFGEGELRYRNAFDRGAYVEAAGILDRIDWLRSDGATRRTALGGAFARQGEHAEAFRQYRRSLELGPTPQAWAGIAKLERGRGDPVAAFDAYERALAFDPVGPRFHAAAADAAFEVGKPKLGVELYRRALDEARDAGDPELVHRLESRLADHIEAR